MKLLRLSTFDNGGVGSHEDTGASAAWKKDIIVACLLTSSAGAEVFLIFAIDFWRVSQTIWLKEEGEMGDGAMAATVATKLKSAFEVPLFLHG